MAIKRTRNIVLSAVLTAVFLHSESLYAQNFPDSARTESILKSLEPVKTPDADLERSTLPDKPEPIATQPKAQEKSDSEPQKADTKDEKLPDVETEDISSGLGIAKIQKAVPSEPEFEVKTIEVKGSTVFDERALRPYLAAMEGDWQTLSKLKGLADTLTRLYQSEGYILSRVVVPAQEITSGHVVLQAVEGSIQDIHFVGDLPEEGRLIQKYAEEIKKSVPLNIKQLERSTLLMNDLPGLSAKAVLSPAKDVTQRFETGVDTTQQSYKLRQTLKAMGLTENQIGNYVDIVGAVQAANVKQVQATDLSLILQGMGIPDNQRKILVKKAVEASDRNRLQSNTQQVTEALVSLSDLNIYIESKEKTASLAIDNFGTKFVGPIQVTGALSIAHDDEARSETSLGFSTSADMKEMKFGEIKHKRQIGDKGTTVEGTYSIARSEPGSTLADLEFESASDVIGVTVEHPVIRSRSKNLKVRATADARSSEVKTLGDRFSKDTTRSVRLGATYDFADEYKGINLIDVELSKGLDILGGDDRSTTSRADGQQDYTKVAAQLSRLQRLGKFTNLLATVRGQYAFNPLLASEEFSFGGASQGRGFDPAELTGDHGIGGTLQLSYDLPMCRKCLKDISMYGFYDAGMVWEENGGTGDDRSFASSAGLGASMNFTDKLSGKIEFAKPLVGSRGNDSEDAKAPVVLMRLKGQL
ncbi:MAG: ShlB/FhaC/HecB family hemolysin secretion/activation protein [Pseudomonadota bacterium]|nr:ShlB/FhaC/HecB family hemolysin secretion/activation protein [Pseudomonadota bacterium]